MRTDDFSRQRTTVKSDPWEMGDKWTEPCDDPSVLPWKNLQVWHRGWTWWTPVVQETKLRIQGSHVSWTSQDRGPEKKELHMETAPEIPTGSPWVFCWELGPYIGENYPKPGKGPPQRFRDKCSMLWQGWEQRGVLSARLENLIIHEASDIVLKNIVPH